MRKRRVTRRPYTFPRLYDMLYSGHTLAILAEAVASSAIEGKGLPVELATALDKLQRGDCKAMSRDERRLCGEFLEGLTR
jgi:hypothetical protein